MRKIMMVLLVLTLIVVSTWFLIRPAQIRVIGTLPTQDRHEIQKLVWHDVKDFEFPVLDWDDIHHMGYVYNGLMRYARLHVLWIEVKDPSYVRVVIGINTNTVATDGWDFMMRKIGAGNTWAITGSASWGISGVEFVGFVLTS